jgi:hypothetical protein
MLSFTNYDYQCFETTLPSQSEPAKAKVKAEPDTPALFHKAQYSPPSRFSQSNSNTYPNGLEHREGCPDRDQFMSDGSECLIVGV